jgi:hypothetical protein
MRTWWLIAAALGLLTELGVAPSAHGQTTLADILANVRRNEKAYENIEVVMDSTYDIGDRKPPSKDEVIRSKVRTRFVSQGERFRLERDGSNQDSERTVSLDRIRAFDGQTTRVLEQKAVGNIARERLQDENFVRPHLLLLRHAHVAVPFSVYLSGHEAIRAHPSGRWQPDLTMRVTYEGDERLNGLKCHKVFVDVLLKSGEPHDGRRFWLAEDRNYLPVKELAFTYRFSKDAPVGQGVVSDLREIKPGVWFPFKAEYTAYNKLAIQQSARQELQWRDRYTVERVALDPKYDREFFAKVEFPTGTAMYEVEGGKIIRSWRQGDR